MAGEAMGQLYTLDEAPAVREVARMVGGLSADEGALVRMLTPARLSASDIVVHRARVVRLLETIRADEALSDYVYAIAPSWDGCIDGLLLSGLVSTAAARHELDCVA
jgi:hypothetical protein